MNKKKLILVNNKLILWKIVSQCQNKIILIGETMEEVNFN